MRKAISAQSSRGVVSAARCALQSIATFSRPTDAIVAVRGRADARRSHFSGFSRYIDGPPTSSLSSTDAVETRWKTAVNYQILGAERAIYRRARGGHWRQKPKSTQIQ